MRIRDRAGSPVESMLCDVCGTALVTPRGDALVQWLADRGPPYGRVVGLVLNHKGECDHVVGVVARTLKLSSLWEDFAPAFGAGPYNSRVEGILEPYTWLEPHRTRLREVDRQMRIAQAAGWTMPEKKIDDWEKRWDAPLRIGPVAIRLAKCFAQEPDSFVEIQADVSKRAGQAFPSLELFIVALLSQEADRRASEAGRGSPNP